jgi:hypothetical protein
MPIRVARFAIDDHTPYRDLSLAHCVFIDEALIPVMYLINEASIAHLLTNALQPSGLPRRSCSLDTLLDTPWSRSSRG